MGPRNTDMGPRNTDMGPRNTEFKNYVTPRNNKFIWAQGTLN